VGCVLEDLPHYQVWGKAINGTELFVYAMVSGTPGLTLTTNGSLTQAEEFNQMFTGGSGNATLRMTYRWHWSRGPLHFLTGLNEPDPSFFHNGAPVPSIKVDYSTYHSTPLWCGDPSECRFLTYTVDMPITFGVPFTYGWTHTISYSFQETDRGTNYIGGNRIGRPEDTPGPYASIPPYMQVIVDGNPVAFSVQDVPEPGTWMLLAGGLGGMFLWRLKVRRAADRIASV